jgi:nucleoside-diphosphate-sugar epimerase
MLSDDMADDQFDSLTREECAPLINIGSVGDPRIRELAETIAQIVGFSGKLIVDTSKPDGTPRKLLDISWVKALGLATCDSPSCRSGTDLPRLSATSRPGTLRSEQP